MQNLPKPVIEEINILNNLAIGIKSVSNDLPERASEFNNTSAIYTKMAEIITQFDWKDYVEKGNSG